MVKEKGIYARNDGRWEARYTKGINEKGKKIYASVYGTTYEEVVEKRKRIVGTDDGKYKNPTHLNLLILGAGSLGRNVLEIAEALHVFHKISFLDDYATGERIIGKCKEALLFRNEYPCAFVAIGDNDKRKKYAEFLKERYFLTPSIVSPFANVSPRASIGEGTLILSQCTVNEAKIGNFCILASNSLVNIDAVVESYSQVDCGGIIPKKTKIPEKTYIEAGEIFEIYK